MPADATNDTIAFTRLRIVLDGGPQPWSVPVDYHRFLRAAVYDLLHRGDPRLAEFLHAGGFSERTPAVDFRRPGDQPLLDPPAPEAFKLFCFSGLLGEGVLRRGRLVFSRPLIWFLSTPLRLLADGLTAGLRRGHRVRIGQVDLKVADLRHLEEPVVDTPLTCVLLSPLVVSAAASADRARSGPHDFLTPAVAGTPCRPHGRRGRRYLTRADSLAVTEARLRSNLLAKHRAIFGFEPEDPAFRFAWTAASTPRPTPDRLTRLLRLSGPRQAPILVRGSLGAVALAGSASLLRIALHAGLGQYNAGGMGFPLPEGELHLLQADS